jgi:hypothetical protein
MLIARVLMNLPPNRLPNLRSVENISFFFWSEK